MNFSFNYSGNFNEQDTSEEVIKVFHQNPRHFGAHKGTSHELGPVHIHDYMQLWYVLNGSFRHCYGNQSFEQGAQDFLFVPPFFSHRIDTSSSTDVEFIFCDLSEGFLNIFPDGNEKNTLFNLAYLRPLFINAEHMKPFLSFSGNTAKQIEYLFFEILKEYEKPGNLSLTYLRSNIVRLLTLVAHEYEMIAPLQDDILYAKYRSAIQDALNYIDEHYTESIYLDEISKIAKMSVRSFSYVFKQITGKTFIEYLQYLKIRKASELLLNTEKSLLDICCECGFCDTLYFCRIFKKITGYPPSVYRKEQRALK